MRVGVFAARRVALVALLLAAPGCVGLGTLESVLGGLGLPGGSMLRGEVRHVDTRRRQIQVYAQNRQRETVRYDSETEVVYRRQRYRVTALEAGDYVSMEVQQDRRGRLFARRIHVERSVQQDRNDGRRGGSGRVQRFEGRVTWVDSQRGQFGMDAQRGGALTVSLPYNPSGSTLNTFRRLRRGSRVRLEGEPLNRDRVELRRFR